MYRFAICDDLLRLRAKHQDHWLSEEHRWGLKQMGTLLCVDLLNETPGCQRILEVGAGLNLYFHNNYGETHDYWIADKSGFYDDCAFSVALEKRPCSTFVDTLLGEFHPDLPDDYFDMVFSISVLEHIPANQITRVCEDMARVTCTGGLSVHSIDFGTRTAKAKASAWLSAFRSAGFNVPDDVVDLTGGVHDRNGYPILFEPLKTLFLYYYKHQNLWTNIQSIGEHFMTLLVITRKTGAG